MKILLLILVTCFSLALQAQLKYRANEDFGLKGEVKTMKVIAQEIVDGDTIFDMFEGVKEYHFSKRGVLQKIIYTNSSIPQNVTSTYKYSDTLVFVSSSSDSLNKGIHILDALGRITFSAPIPKSYTPNAYLINQLKRSSTFLFTNYYYNKKGKLVEYISYEPDTEIDTAYLNSQHLFKYNRKGLLIKEIINLNDKKGNRIITYKYDRKRRLIKETKKYHDNAISLQNDVINNYQYVTNTSKKIERVTTLTTSPYKYFMPSKYTTHHQYDERGNLIKSEEYDVDLHSEKLVRLITYQIKYYD